MSQVKASVDLLTRASKKYAELNRDMKRLEALMHAAYYQILALDLGYWRNIRLNAGLTLQQVGAIAGIAHSAIHAFENGRRMRIDLCMGKATMARLVQVYQDIQEKDLSPWNSPITFDTPQLSPSK